MTKIFNKAFNILKYLIVIISFSVTIYIILFMYKRLGKNPLGSDLLEFLGVLLPYILVLLVFTINVTLKERYVKENTLFNVACVLSLSAILFICYRTLFDENMVLWGKYGYNMNFNYFADHIPQIKIILYTIFSANIFLIVEGNFTSKKKLNTI